MKKSNVLVAIQFFLFAVLLLGLIVFMPVSSSTVRVMGSIVAIVGIFLALFAIIQFGRIANDTPNISPEPKTTIPLVQSGIYAHIRHPIYTGVICSALGVAIAHGHIVVLLIALLFIPFFTVKSMFEERLLHQQYDEYSTYVTRSGRFLPFL